MKSLSFSLNGFLLIFLFMGMAAITKGQSTVVAGVLSVEYATVDSKYHVYFKPTTGGSGSIGNGSTIGITAPVGNTLTFSNLTSTTGTWLPGGVNMTGGGSSTTGSTTLNYWDFYTAADQTVNFIANTPVELFNFTASGSCNGGSLNINTSTNTVISSAQYGTVIIDLAGAVNQAGDANASTAYNPNTALCVQLASLMSCTTNSLSPNVFTVGTSNNSAVYTIGLVNAIPGNYTFTEITAANFATNPATYTATGVTTGQTSVQIPITYNGGGVAGSQTLTLQMTDPNGATSTSTCTVSATINAAAVVAVGNPSITINGTTNGGAQTGTASSEMSPSGAASYVYSTTTNCTAPSGTTALPVGSNLAITNTSTGAYSYTTPTTAGSYFYCIQVCDATNPTNCSTSTYTLNVSAVCNAGSVAPSVN